MPSNKLPHVVDRVDRHAEPADFAQRPRIVAVEAHQRRQIEGRAQAGLAFFEQEAESLIRLPRRAEAGELPHRPQPAAIHAGVHAARERILTGIAERRFVIETFQIVGRVERFDRHAADGRGRLLARRRFLDFLAPLRPQFAIHGGSHFGRTLDRCGFAWLPLLSGEGWGEGAWRFLTALALTRLAALATLSRRERGFTLSV